jgi:hypothetical protein
VVEDLFQIRQVFGEEICRACVAPPRQGSLERR